MAERSIIGPGRELPRRSPAPEAEEAEPEVTEEGVSARPRIRACDMFRCKDAGYCVVTLDLSGYTGRDGDEIDVVLCRAHGDQYQAGFIVGFAWTPVHRGDLPVAQRPSAPGPGQLGPPPVMKATPPEARKGGM